MENSFIDLIIRIKNAYMAGNLHVSSPHSKLKEQVVKKLLQLHYLKGYAVKGELKKQMDIELLYQEGNPALTGVTIVSKPGQKNYVSYKKIAPVLSGYGSSVLSTSKGILSGKEAKEAKIGGELLFNVW